MGGTLGAEARINARLRWHLVTNEMVTLYADPKCGDCGGDGKTGDDEAGYGVCPCARLRFRDEFRNRLRPARSGRGLEYRDLVAVEEPRPAQIERDRTTMNTDP